MISINRKHSYWASFKIVFSLLEWNGTSLGFKFIKGKRKKVSKYLDWYINRNARLNVIRACLGLLFYGFPILNHFKFELFTKKSIYTQTELYGFNGEQKSKRCWKESRPKLLLCYNLFKSKRPKNELLDKMLILEFIWLTLCTEYELVADNRHICLIKCLTVEIVSYLLMNFSFKLNIMKYVIWIEVF